MELELCRKRNIYRAQLSAQQWTPSRPSELQVQT